MLADIAEVIGGKKVYASGAPKPQVAGVLGKPGKKVVQESPAGKEGAKGDIRQQMKEVRDQYEGTPQWMKAPNGEPTNLPEAQWLLSRTPAFKKRFGDWEGFKKRQFLDGKPVAETSTVDVPTGGFADLREWAVGIFEKQGGKAKSALLGEVIMGERSVRDSLAHGGANKYKKAAFAVVKDVIEKGILVHNSVNNGRDSYYFAAPVRIDTQENIVVALVHRNEKNNTFYLHSVGTKKSLLADRVSDQTSSKAEHHRSNPAEGYLESLREIFDVNPDTVSKAVDENGEPLLSDTKQAASIEEETQFSIKTSTAQPVLTREDFEKSQKGQAGTVQGSPDIVNPPLTVIRAPDVKPGSGVSAPETIKLFSRIMEVLGAAGAVRIGKLRSKRFLGVYEVHSKVARIRTANDVSTAAHELMHALDDKLFGFGSWDTGDTARVPKSVRSELEKLGKELYGDETPVGGYVSEGFAEFGRLWLTDFDQARFKSPQAVEWFGGILAQNTKLQNAFAEAQQAGNMWFRQGAMERIRQSVAPMEKTPLQKIAISRREASLAFRRNWLEAATPLQDFVEEALEKGAKLANDSADPFAMLTARRMSADSKAAYMANKGMLDFWGNVTGGPLNDVFAGLGKRADAFIYYLWARRSLALLNDPKGGC